MRPSNEQMQNKQQVHDRIKATEHENLSTVLLKSENKWR